MLHILNSCGTLERPAIHRARAYICSATQGGQWSTRTIQPNRDTGPLDLACGPPFKRLHRLTIVLFAGMNEPLRCRQLRGESEYVAGIPAWELSMISKCANPTCNTDFHYLRGGRLYRFDLRCPVQPCKDVPNAICADKPSQASIYFWLCDRCSIHYTLRFSTQNGISVLPLQHARRATVVADVAQAE